MNKVSFLRSSFDAIQMQFSADMHRNRGSLIKIIYAARYLALLVAIAELFLILAAIF